MIDVVTSGRNLISRLNIFQISVFNLTSNNRFQVATFICLLKHFNTWTQREHGGAHSSNAGATDVVASSLGGLVCYMAL